MTSESVPIPAAGGPANASSGRDLAGPAPSIGDRAGLAAREYLILLVQLILLCTFVWQFHLDESHYLLVSLGVVTAGFAVHVWLSQRAGLAWFLILSAGCMVLMLGWTDAACAAGVAVVLVGIAWCPLSVRVRALLLIACAAALFILRGESDRVFWPVVGSMFMFRMLIYVVESRRFKTRPSLLMTASYFLMLPNIFYPLFPIVDFRTFCDTADREGERRRETYQSGVHWMFLGVAQLLLYRLIRTEALPVPYEVRTLRDVALYLAANYGLYVRISGQFHVVVGMLHLFGFNLPRTHDNYFLAASFTDIWRRINIYWKDFLSTFVFFPAFFRLRRMGDAAAVPLAVLCVFAATWAGHSWQAFWLTGTFPLRTGEAAAWLIIGLLVAVNALLDYRRASRREAPPEMTPAAAISRSLKILGVFTAVSLFWAWWSNPEICKYLLFTARRAGIEAPDVLWIGGCAGAFLLVATVSQVLMARRIDNRIPIALLSDRTAVLRLAPIIALLLFAQLPVASIFGAKAGRFVANLQSERVTAAEALATIDGYYEQLNETRQSAPFLSDPVQPRPAHAVDFSDMIQRRDDLLEHELIPQWRGSFGDVRTTTNRWGMRDRDRALQKPDHTIRIAVVGSSLVMGFGVQDDETFTRLLEGHLNADRPTSGPHYEVLNFGVGRYFPLHRRLQIEHKVLAFEPDVVLYVAHQDELYTSARRVATGIYHGMDLEDECLEDLAETTGALDHESEAMMQVTMEQHHPEILQCTYRHIAETCREATARLLYVYLPIPGAHDLPFDPRLCVDMAARNGHITVDLDGWWENYTAEEVLLGPIDYHPNPLGHELIAGALMDQFDANRDLIDGVNAHH